MRYRREDPAVTAEWEADKDDACEHGETGICLDCPILMQEIRDPGASIPAVALLPFGILVLILLLAAMR